MRAANIDGVGVTSDAIFQRMEVRHDAAFVQQNLEMAHGHLVIRGIVECEMTNLKNLRNERTDMVGNFHLGCNTSSVEKVQD